MPLANGNYRAQRLRKAICPAPANMGIPWHRVGNLRFRSQWRRGRIRRVACAFGSVFLIRDEHPEYESVRRPTVPCCCHGGAAVYSGVDTQYWQAWTFLVVYFASSAAITLYLMKKDSKLLQRRMSGGPTAEKKPAQTIIMFFASLGFIDLIIFPALDHRFKWSRVPPYVALVGDVLVALGFLAIKVCTGTPTSVKESKNRRESSGGLPPAAEG
jgi:hypothetical protein